MARLWQFLTDSRVLGTIGLLAVAAFLLLGMQVFALAAVWAVVAGVTLLALWGGVWLGRRAWRRRQARLLGETVAAVPGAGDNGDADADADAGSCTGAAAGQAAQAADRAGAAAVLRKGMLDAIGTIKTSKLGLVSGAAALYELPWYMVIGNPAAGKSSAIGSSGLQFPIAGSKTVQGVGGTRNCDWFFTSQGILLDTAGRYSTVDSDRSEWFSFLGLLRKYRRRAPINGILICVSVAELMGANPKKSIDLAKSLRTRVQELTERLNVFVPVYVIFTKADLIAGFADFFHDSEKSERERVWGATMRYNRRSTSPDVLAFFDEHFDLLHEGLKEMSLASMANRSATMRPGVFTFPPEFASIKTPLRSFLATLFDENTYQFKPVFRGFYFTSALQEGSTTNQSSRRVASRFDLALKDQRDHNSDEQSGYFLLDLFRKVIFADRDLVARYTSPSSARWKYGAFFSATILLGCALGAWSWSTISNRQLVANVQADLNKVARLQDKRGDLQVRLEALEILQDRIEQLDKYRREKPWMLGFGLYQGEALERKLRDEYFGGVREVMLLPVAAALEAHLAEMNASAARMEPVTPGALPAIAPAPTRAGQPYQDASVTSVTDGYNALKTYLMLSDKARAEPGHLNDQLTRFWRGWLEASRGAMPREQMIRSAERLLSFYVTQVSDPAWPQLTPKLGLLDAARENLRKVVRGTPARERVYAEIRARAATRFNAITVARIVGQQDHGLLGGSASVSGAFTREAWEGFVAAAIREASVKELQSTDWVLKTAVKDDLTLEGSPEQIQKKLTEMYKSDYILEWQKFVQGVTVGELAGFDGAINAINRLGDTQTSPLARLLDTIYRQTCWDNPGAAADSASAMRERAGKGVWAAIMAKVSGSAPSEVRDVVQLPQVAAANADPNALGALGREFAGVARLVGLREKQASLMGGYLDALLRVRARLGQLKNQGDPGPGARQLMQQTLEGSGSELADALKYVDEQMLTGMSESQKLALRPILVRPLLQTFAVIVAPSEAELNKTWRAQVLDPFQKNLAASAPFTPGALEASPAEIGQVFGPEGAIARFVATAMGPLVVRRGDVVSPRTWGDIGITIAADHVARLPGWMAPLSANGIAPGGVAQTVFQLLPQPVPGIAEYTVEIAGQQMRYKNATPAWTNMVHPGPQGVPGARVSAVTLDGRTVDLFSDGSDQGLKKMIDAATRKRKDGGVFELRWMVGLVSVTVDLKIVSAGEAGAGGAGGQGFRGLRLPATIAGRESGPAPSTPAIPAPPAPPAPPASAIAANTAGTP